MLEVFRRIILESIEEKGRAEGAPIVNFMERIISVQGDDIYVGQKPLEWYFQVSAFYLALPPNTAGVVVSPDGKCSELEGKLHEVPPGVYSLYYVDKRERTDISKPVFGFTVDGKKLAIQVILRYCVKNPVLALSKAHPVESLIEHIETDMAHYIRDHDYNGIVNTTDDVNSELFLFFSERHNRRKPLSDAIDITGIELKEFIDDREYVEMRRKGKIQLESKTLSPALQKIQQEQEKRLPPTGSPKISPSKTSSEIIFISYRRTDSADISGRIYDRLLGKFGKDAIFKDVDSIPLGFDFKEYLEKKVSECNILLAIVGDRWLEASDSAGKNRLDDPNDFVRLEIESALARNIPVIPLLVRGAVIPAEEQLPISLRKLFYRNGIQIRPDPDFHRDMDRLMFYIEKYLQTRNLR